MTCQTMRIARVHGPGDVRLDEVAIPLPEPDEAIVRVVACGICGSDLGYIAAGGLGGVEALKEPLPIGHEFAGIVEAIGTRTSGLVPGMHVAINPDLDYIGGGGSEGAMAPFVRIRGPVVGQTLFPLPDHVDFTQAALAEPLSVALHAIRLMKVQPHEKVAVLGAGPIGLCAVVMLRSMGVEDIAVFDRVPARLDRALALGARHAIDVSDRSLADALCAVHGESERFGARCAETHVYLDCAGAPPALTQAFAVAGYRARIAIIALYKKPVPLDLWRMMANEITISGSIALDRASEFGAVLDMIASGELDLDPLISHTIPFDAFHEALGIAADADQSAKVMLTFKAEAA